MDQRNCFFFQLILFTRATTLTLFLSQNLFKLSQLVLKWPWSCRSNLQKCLENLNLAKLSSESLNRGQQKELPQILHSKGFFFNLS